MNNLEMVLTAVVVERNKEMLNAKPETLESTVRKLREGTPEKMTNVELMVAHVALEQVRNGHVMSNKRLDKLQSELSELVEF